MLVTLLLHCREVDSLSRRRLLDRQFWCRHCRVICVKGSSFPRWSYDQGWRRAGKATVPRFTITSENRPIFLGIARLDEDRLLLFVFTTFELWIYVSLDIHDGSKRGLPTDAKARRRNFIRKYCGVSMLRREQALFDPQHSHCVIMKRFKCSCHFYHSPRSTF